MQTVAGDELAYLPRPCCALLQVKENGSFGRLAKTNGN